MQLRQAREEKGMSQEDLARQSGVSLETVRLIESGEAQDPERSAVHALAAAMGINPPEIEEFRPGLGLTALGETGVGEAAPTGARDWGTASHAGVSLPRRPPPRPEGHRE